MGSDRGAFVLVCKVPMPFSLSDPRCKEPSVTAPGTVPLVLNLWTSRASPMRRAIARTRGLVEGYAL